MPSLVPVPRQQQDIKQAYDQIRPYVVRTPLLTSATLNDLLGNGGRHGDNTTKLEIYFKAENMQQTGSFKFRGMLNALLSLPEGNRAKGLVTTSSGNAARALVVASSMTGDYAVPVWAVMPETALESKVRAVEKLGGTVVTSGPSWASRSQALQQLSANTGATIISADSNPAILLGNGTVGLEFAEQIRQATGKKLDCVIAPCGTGSLLAGLALAFRGSHTKVFGVEPAAGGDDALRGRKSGFRVTHVESDSIADGLRSPVSPLAWELIRDQDLVQDIFSVTEEQILMALRIAAKELKVVIEPSAAVGLAACLFNKKLHRMLEQEGMQRVGVVFTGGNLELADLATMLHPM